MSETLTQQPGSTSSVSLKDYIELCKPRVVALMVLTAVIAMLLASPTGLVSWQTLLYGTLGIAFAGFAGGTINHLIDRKIDMKMARTKGRPIPSGRIKPSHAIALAAILSIASMVILYTLVNPATAYLSLLTLIGYAGVYTLFLKRATPQNIVIGGLAGAMPPLLGWVAVTGHIDGLSLLLVLIIFTWTPPHFWSLSIARAKEYEKANVPMLPVTHGIQYTKLNVLLYGILMVAVTYMPFVVDMSGLIYLAGITLLNGAFMYRAIRLYKNCTNAEAMRNFRFSILYLAVLFLILLVDHYIPLLT